MSLFFLLKIGMSQFFGGFETQKMGQFRWLTGVLFGDCLQILT